jgi:hypothetical protein
MGAFYTFMLHLHSVGRWVMLILLLVALFGSLTAGQRLYTKADAKKSLFLMITADLMLLIGLYLWFVGPWGLSQIQDAGMSAVMKNNTMRFFAIEHITAMIIAIALIHVGKAQGKKDMPDKKKHARTAIFYALALVVILASIPWPFREIGAGRGWY